MKHSLLLFFLTAALLAAPAPAHADRAEQARVIRVDKETTDLIVERQNGEPWLLQHQRVCNSMSTEYPVELLMDADGKITRLKVGFNEICEVFKAFSYGGDVILQKTIPSRNKLVADHEADVLWKGGSYRIDYGEGCKALYDFAGKKLYLSGSEALTGARVVLPGNRGSCLIKKSSLQEAAKGMPEAKKTITGLQHKAENNEAYFYWEPLEEASGKQIYLMAYSRYRLKPELYEWNKMPNLQVTRENSYTLKKLANNITYYVYVGARFGDGSLANWSEVVIKPQKNVIIPQNHPDPEPFDVKVSSDEAGAWWLKWPAKENVHKWQIAFYVNGKLTEEKNLKSGQTAYRIAQKPSYKGKRFRFTVRSWMQKPTQAPFFDGVYWEGK